jgi:hypothetical protein
MDIPRINYVIDKNHLDMYKYRNQKKIEAEADLEYFKKSAIVNDTNIEECNIFINASIQSNGYMNFFNDENKYIGKIINIYFHKKDAIEFIFKIYIQDKNIMKKLKNIILNCDFDYYTPLRHNIEQYIKDNNILNYFIYY